MIANVAVVGAGWAGCTAALVLARAGLSVHVFEAARVAGGRARRVEHDGRTFDNGQHLLLGVYHRTLAMIESVHDRSGQLPLLRVPLALRSAPGAGNRLRIDAPALPAPLHLLAALAGAKGFTIGERLSTMLWAGRVLQKTAPAATLTVAQLIAGQPPAVRALLWEPLCVAALNTPAGSASAQVFVEVLRRAFSGHRRNSDLVIPTADLTTVFPAPALAEVARRGGQIHCGATVRTVTDAGEAGATVHLADDEHRFDAVIVATGPQHVARLLPWDRSGLAATLTKLAYEPITTLHFEFPFVFPGVDTSLPMLMLDGDPGQWLFWQLLANGRWRASVVISAHHRADDDGRLSEQTLAQLRRSYGLPAPTWQMLISEKRATYACTPAQTAALRTLPRRLGNIHFAADWCVPELPATLESAVVAGESAAMVVMKEIHG